MAGDDGELTARPENPPAPRDRARADEEIAQIREAIEQSRRQIDASLQDIRREFDEAADWRGWVERHPWQAVGSAFFVGFYLGFR